MRLKTRNVKSSAGYHTVHPTINVCGVADIPITLYTENLNPYERPKPEYRCWQFSRILEDFKLRTSNFRGVFKSWLQLCPGLSDQTRLSGGNILVKQYYNLFMVGKVLKMCMFLPYWV